MIDARFVSDAAPKSARHLGFSAATRKANAGWLQHRQRARIEAVARPRETNGHRNAMLATTRRDRFELLGQLRHRPLRDAHVVTRVIADLEAIAVQLRDLLPCHVVPLVGAK